MFKVGKPELLHVCAMILAVLGVKSFYALDLPFLFLYTGAHLVLAALFFMLRPISPRVFQIVYLIALLPLSALVVLHADNYATYGPILKESLNAIFQTTNAEAVSYLTEFTSPYFLPVLCLYLSILIATKLIQSNASLPRVYAFGLLLLGCVIAYQGKVIPLMILETAQDYHQKLNAFKDNREAAMAPFNGLTSSEEPRTVVLLLTESLTRHHMSLYGYPRTTTPSLDALTSEMLVFPDVISTHSHTNQSLSRALTLNQKDEYADFETLPDLLSALNLAGVSTHWYSNQNTMGRWDNIVSVLSSQATESRFHDASSGRKLTREVFDEVLLDSLDDLLAEKTDQSRFIVLHTMATHFPYCSMVPDDYVENALSYSEPRMDERFFGGFLPWLATTLNQQQMVNYFSSLNCYDRAVNYVDDIAGKVIERVKATDHQSAVLITADHGEAVIYSSGHDARKHTSMHVEVPFVLWRSETFPRETVDTQIKGTLEDLAYSIAGLFDISGIEGLERRDMFSAEYANSDRRTLNGRIGYDVFDPAAHELERVRANLNLLTETDQQKVWTHRVNSGGMLMDVGQMFAGIETDAVFFEGEFRIFHPPAADVGWSLAALLKQAPQDRRIWLDWKNADLSNIHLAVARLEALNQQFDFKDQALIEISATDGSAAVLSAAGWHVSYYLPTGRVNTCIEACNEQQLRALATDLLQIYQSNGFTAVSFDARLLAFVEPYLSETLKSEGIPAYSWATWIDASQEGAPEQMTAILARSWIQSLLVSVPSQFRR